MKRFIVVTTLLVALPVHAAKLTTSSTKVINVEQALFCAAPPIKKSKVKKGKQEPITKINQDFYLDLLRYRLNRSMGSDRLFLMINHKSDLLLPSSSSDAPRNCLSVESTIKTKDLSRRDNITKLAISSTIWY
jgi:hypothetical protein